MTESTNSTQALLRMKGISKSFGPVNALRDVDIDIMPGDIVGLCGDNGAGKSTLIKVISGYHAANEGTMSWEGKEVKFSSPHDARDAGIETVYQEQALAPNMSIARNIFMGREPTRFLGLMDKKAMADQSMEALTSMGLHIRSPNILVATLSGGQRQGVAIARVIHFKAKLVIMDEPTIALAVKEVREVLEFVRHLKREGVAVIFISHTLPHVVDVTDRIMVMAHGTIIADIATSETDVDDLSDIIVRGTYGE